MRIFQSIIIFIEIGHKEFTKWLTYQATQCWSQACVQGNWNVAQLLLSLCCDAMCGKNFMCCVTSYVMYDTWYRQNVGP